MKEISVKELQDLRRDRPELVLVDVRTDEEIDIASLPNTRHIPLQALPTRIGELDPTATIALLCHHGARSEMAARFLERNGFEDVSNVTGGIDAWSLQIDPEVPRY